MKFIIRNLVMTALGNPKAEDALHIAIAHWIAAHLLPFSMAEDALFKRVLVKARATNHKYAPPKRYQVAGQLLDANFAAYKRDALEMLLADAETYGVSIFGDDATIGKTPMINILASSPTNPSYVLDVVDCTNHMMAAGKKMHGILHKFYLSCNILILTKIVFMLLLSTEHTMSKKQVNFCESTIPKSQSCRGLNTQLLPSLVSGWG